MSCLVTRIADRPRALLTLTALGALATAALLASPTVASAAQPEETAVYYNLSDLATDQGARKVNQRIVDAAEAVCPPEDTMSSSAAAASRDCQRQAIARALAQIGSARLAALHNHMVAQRR